MSGLLPPQSPSIWITDSQRNDPSDDQTHRRSPRVPLQPYSGRRPSFVHRILPGLFSLLTCSPAKQKNTAITVTEIASVPPSIICQSLRGSHTRDDVVHEKDPSNDVQVNLPSPPSIGTTHPKKTRVHFRSRVRITSGISRHRHCLTQPPSPTLRHSSPPHPSSSSPIPIAQTYTLDSSLSSSPSSSISAPLRRDDMDKPGWGPLGRRVSLLSYKKNTRRKKRAEDTVQRPSERTPLMPADLRQIEDERCHESDDVVEPEQEEVQRASEIDRVFGTFPGRLLNRYWWWRQVEPIVRCHCLDESDTE